MNKKLYDIIQKHQLHPKRYQKIRSVYIIDDRNKRLSIKLNTNNYDIYQYLISRDFPYFPTSYNNINDDYDILEYIDNLPISKEQKINDYIDILAYLHHKTSYKREIDLDEIKEIYENINNKINSLQNHYHQLNNMIDKEMFLSPAMYLLVCNLSLIYKILKESFILLNEVYDNIKNTKSMRVALLHNNIDLDHLITNEHSYLISWDKAYFASPVYELETFYRKYYHLVELKDFLKTYELTNQLSTDEKKLLLVLLAIPKELQLSNDTYNDTRVINNEINYLNKVYELLASDGNKT